MSSMMKCSVSISCVVAELARLEDHKGKGKGREINNGVEA